jgi:glycosyltransferase involved in cell wall biosynthesis
MTNAGGCTELIDKNTGIITPLKDSKSIGEAISKLANNDALRKQMGNNSKERIKNVYHINDTVDGTLNLYKQFLTS